MQTLMSAQDLMAFMVAEFDQVANDFIVEEVGGGKIRVRMAVAEQHLRPGGTVSGPSMFALADVSAYLATLALIGPKALAVTTNCSIDFMRKPVAGVDLVAYATVLKLGKLLSVTDVLIHSHGMEQPVARATLTYAIPPR